MGESSCKLGCLGGSRWNDCLGPRKPGVASTGTHLGDASLKLAVLEDPRSARRELRVSRILGHERFRCKCAQGVAATLIINSVARLDNAAYLDV